MKIEVNISATWKPELKAAREALLRGRLEEARELCQRGAKSAATAGDQLALSWFRLLLGQCLSAQGRHHEAIQLLESTSSEITDAGLTARILNQRAFAHLLTGGFSAAKVLLARALEVAATADSEILRAEVEMGRCALFFYLANYDAVETCARAALEIAERNSCPEMEATATAGVAKAEMYRRRHDSAIAWFTRARNLYQDLGLPFHGARMASEIGCCLMAQGELDKADEYFKEALRTSQEAGALPNLHIDLANRGVLHYRRGEYAEALPYLQKALEISRGLGDAISTGKWLYNLSLIYARMDKPTLAKSCELEAIHVLERVVQARAKAR